MAAGGRFSGGREGVGPAPASIAGVLRALAQLPAARATLADGQPRKLIPPVCVLDGASGIGSPSMGWLRIQRIPGGLHLEPQSDRMHPWGRGLARWLSVDVRPDGSRLPAAERDELARRYLAEQAARREAEQARMAIQAREEQARMAAQVEQDRQAALARQAAEAAQSQPMQALPADPEEEARRAWQAQERATLATWRGIPAHEIPLSMQDFRMDDSLSDVQRLFPAEALLPVLSRLEGISGTWALVEDAHNAACLKAGVRAPSGGQRRRWSQAVRAGGCPASYVLETLSRLMEAL